MHVCADINRLSRGLPPGATPAALPYPMRRRLSSPSPSRAPPPGCGPLGHGGRRRGALGGARAARKKAVWIPYPLIPSIFYWNYAIIVRYVGSIDGWVPNGNPIPKFGS